MHSSVSSQPRGRVPTRPRPLGEPADRVEDLPAERHVGADQVAHGRGRRRQADVAAADHPVELRREPAGRAARATRARRSADADHRRVSIGRRPGAPASRARRAASSSRKATTSPPAWATPVLRRAGEPGRPVLATTDSSGKRGAGPLEQPRVVVDDEDGPHRWPRLRPDGGHGGDDVRPSAARCRRRSPPRRADRPRRRATAPWCSPSTDHRGRAVVRPVVFRAPLDSRGSAAPSTGPFRRDFPSARWRSSGAPGGRRENALRLLTPCSRSRS